MAKPPVLAKAARSAGSVAEVRLVGALHGACGSMQAGCWPHAWGEGNGMWEPRCNQVVCARCRVDRDGRRCHGGRANRGRAPGRRARTGWRAAAGGGEPSRVADGRRVADAVGGSHRPRPDVRLGAVAGARQGPGGLRLPGARVHGVGHRQRRALHHAAGRANADRRLEVQRPGAGRGDARQRRRPHVRVHLDLHDVVGPRRGGDPDHAAGAVRRAERAPVSRHEAERRADQRDPGAGGLAGPRRGLAARAGAEDGARPARR